MQNFNLNANKFRLGVDPLQHNTVPFLIAIQKREITPHYLKLILGALEGSEGIKSRCSGVELLILS